MMHDGSWWGGLNLTDELAMAGFSHERKPNMAPGSGVHVVSRGRKVVFVGTAKDVATWLDTLREAGTARSITS